MGYGSRALKALNAYYSGEVMSVDEETRAEPGYPFPGNVGKVRVARFKRVFFLMVGEVDGSAHRRTFYSCPVGDAATTAEVVRKETRDLGLPWCLVRSHTTTPEVSVSSIEASVC